MTPWRVLAADLLESPSRKPGETWKTVAWGVRSEQVTSGPDVEHRRNGHAIAGVSEFALLHLNKGIDLPNVRSC
jgi:hypothetical protein